MSPLDTIILCIWVLAALYLIIVAIIGIDWDIKYRFVPPEVFLPFWYAAIPLFVAINIHLIWMNGLFGLAVCAVNCLNLMIIKLLWRKKVFYGGDARLYFGLALLVPLVIVVPIVLCASLGLGYLLGLILSSKSSKIKQNGYPMYTIITPFVGVCLLGTALYFISLVP